MSAAETSLTPITAPAQARRDLVQRMLEIGAELLEDLRPIQAPAHPSADPQTATPADPLARADAYERLSRALRRNILLAQHLEIEPDPDRAAALARRTATRQRILRSVEDAIATGARDPAVGEILRAELLERLDAPDLDADLATIPIDEIIADMIRDLGLLARIRPFRGKRRTPANLAILRAHAANLSVLPTASTPPPEVAAPPQQLPPQPSYQPSPRTRPPDDAPFDIEADHAYDPAGPLAHLLRHARDG